MTKKTFSLIGAGRMGQNHLQVALNLGLEISAIYDVSIRSLENISLPLPSSTLLTNDFDKFIEQPTPDITVIATTAPSHSGLIEATAKAGRKVLICEKPLATSISELSQITKLVDDYGLQIAVNHQMRFMDQYRLVKKFQHKYKLGELCTMSVNGANFGLGMNATHYIEAFHWLNNAEISRVSGRVKRQARPNVRGKEFYDYAGFALIESESGALLFIDFQEKLGHQVLVVYNFEFGKIVVNELIGTLSVDCRLEEDLNQETFRYGLPGRHFEFNVKPTELIDSTAELYNQLLFGTDYPNHLDGARTVRAAIATIHSTMNNGTAISPMDPMLGTIDGLSWP